MSSTNAAGRTGIAVEHLSIVGLNHRTAGIDIRERCAVAEADVAARLSEVRALPGIEEAVLVSTCNRVELYTLSDDPDTTADAMRRRLIEWGRLGHIDPDAVFYAHSGGAAVRHLFRVAASVDSMVVGEPQILGQVKDAYSVANDAGTVGPVLNRLFHRAFRSAKRVRTETAIGENPVSVSTAAVTLATKIFGDLTTRRVLLVGAGNMVELAADYFAREGVQEILVANRTFDRAVEVARTVHGTPLNFEHIFEYLPRVDIILTSTGSPTPIITAERVHEALKQRRHKPLFFIDIAVPRDVDPGVNDIDAAYLYDIDDLGAVVNEFREKREAEADRAEILVADEAAKFVAWARAQQVVPTIRALRKSFEDVAEQEMERVLPMINGSADDSREAVRTLMRAVVNKLLHTPTTRLKTLERGATPDEQPASLADAIVQLFDLEVEVAEDAGDEESSSDES